MENLEWIETFIDVEQSGLEVVAGVCYECGLTGLMIHDQSDFQDFLNNDAREWDYIAEELVEEKTEQETGITFFVRDNVYGAEQLNHIKQEIEKLKTMEFDFPIGTLEITMKNVKEEDWANNWKKYFKPFPIGEKLMIKPSWETLAEETERTILSIDPAHVFGTGTHETTQLCLELLEKHVQAEDTLLDIGCGSGILSIGGLLLGAKHADALDIDPNAIQIAYENSDMNDIDREKYTVLSGNILEDTNLQQTYENREYDIVVANIVADIIIALSEQVPKYVKKGGIFLCSGIILQRQNDVEEALKEKGFALLEANVKNEWVALAMKYEG